MCIAQKGKKQILCVMTFLPMPPIAWQICAFGVCLNASSSSFCRDLVSSDSETHSLFLSLAHTETHISITSSLFPDPIEYSPQGENKGPVPMAALFGFTEQSAFSSGKTLISPFPSSPFPSQQKSNDPRFLTGAVKRNSYTNP
jgi:hypothetical protein